MNELERISCHNFGVNDGYAFFSNWFYNGLFKVDIGTGKTTFLGHFKGETIYERNIHFEIFSRGGNIYFCPRRGRHIHIYNLQEQTQHSIEIRGKEEEPFVISEIVLGKDNVFFVPKQKKVSVREWNMNSLNISKINDKVKIRGENLSTNREVFPGFQLMQKYHIELADKFFWKRVSDVTWCGFLPMGCHLLKYMEGTDKIDIIPLSVVNKEKLEEYLHKVKMEFLKENLVFENRMNIQEFINEISSKEISGLKILRNDRDIGGRTWKGMKKKAW